MHMLQEGDKGILINVGKTVLVLTGFMITAIVVANLF